MNMRKGIPTEPCSRIIRRYRWAGEVARIAMGKTKAWGDKQPHDVATDDPLAWWCLVELIAEGGPK